LNLSQTAAILKIAGPAHQPFNRHHLQRTKDGVFLKITRREGQVTLIRLVAQQTWLGIRLSFGAYATQTVKYRLHCAKNVLYLLTKWLRGKGGLSKQQKLELWQQCVYTNLLHGLPAVGLTTNQLTPN